MNIDNDDLYVGGATVLNGATTINSTLSTSSITTSQPSTFNASITAKQFYCSANSVNYSNMNGSSAWFIPINNYWYLPSVSTGYSYLNCCINTVSVNGGTTYTAYWMGRIAVSSNGGIIGFYADCSGQNDSIAQLDLANFWDTTGGNYIRVASYRGLYHGGTGYFKIYG